MVLLVVREGTSLCALVGKADDVTCAKVDRAEIF